MLQLIPFPKFLLMFLFCHFLWLSSVSVCLDMSSTSVFLKLTPERQKKNVARGSWLCPCVFIFSLNSLQCFLPFHPSISLMIQLIKSCSIFACERPRGIVLCLGYTDKEQFRQQSMDWHEGLVPILRTWWLCSRASSEGQHWFEVLQLCDVGCVLRA